MANQREVLQYLLDLSGLSEFFVPELLLGSGNHKMGVTNEAPHFYLLPAILPTCGALVQACNALSVDPRLLTVTSGYRSMEYNAVVGGVPNSSHRDFTALDVFHPHLSPKALAEGLEGLDWADKLGIGRYETFVHVDSRWFMGKTAPVRWDTTSG
jgi:hypothetical protein